MLYDTDPNLQINLAKVWGGSTIDRVTGKVLGDDGNPVMMPTFEKGLKSVAAQSLIHGAFDPDVMISANLGAIDRGIDDRKKALSEIAKLPINAQKIGNINGEIARLKAQKAEHVKMRDDPDSRIGLLQKQLAVANGFSSQAVAQGAGPELIKLFVNQQDNITKQIITWQTHKFDMAKQKGDKDAQRVPQLMHAVLLDPPSPSRVLQTVQIGVPKVTQGMLPESIDPKLKGWVWADQAQFNKPVKSKSEAIQQINETTIENQISKNYGVPNKDNTQIMIFPEKAFANQMALKIFSNQMSEMRKKHGDIDWNSVSSSALRQFAIDKQKEHLDFYYAEQAKRDAIVNMVKSAKNLTPQQKQEKLKTELEIYDKNMQELDTVMQKEYGGLPDPTFNPWIPGSETYVKAQQEKRGM